ncbi:MAG TPA: ABC transporter permease [Candidatus Limnocylindrales bacterium]|nr:ABC transporter permease [Candidatus Limnocylindrales bacterium]
MQGFNHIFRLGVKELRSLWADKVLLIFLLVAFSVLVYSGAKGTSRELHNAPIAVVDQDRSQLTERIVGAFYGPYFKTPEIIAPALVDPGLDEGRFTFVLDIPPNFQRDVLAGHRPAIQVNIDATRMTQAFIGANYIQNIVTGEVDEFIRHRRAELELPIKLVTHVKFNPNLSGLWFGGMMEIIEQITMLSIILTGAALIREREHGTIEHLLVMPLRPFEIMTAKVWANGLAILIATALSVRLVIQEILQVPIAGSVPLFLLGAALYLFSTTSMGIFLGTVARSMPQLGLLVILVILPLVLLSGAVTPRESMPQVVQIIMQAAPTTHFVSLTHGIIYRGAGFDVVWPQFVALVGIGVVFFTTALLWFRKAIVLN